jgi:hypothetical protein
MKVDIDSVEHRMAEAQIDNKEIQAVLAALKQEISDAKAAKEAQPKIIKNKYVIARTNLPAGTKLTETPMQVVEAPDDVAWNAIIDEIKNAANTANNDCKKLKNDPLKSIFDTLDRCPSKYLKQYNIRLVSKEMPQVLETDNLIV